MLLFVARRLVSVIPVFLLTSVIVFGLLLLVPGDPAITLAGENATAAKIAEVRAGLGLDLPIYRQYLDYLGGVVTGDLGTSLYSGESVSSIVARRLPPTIALTAVATVYAVLVALFLGIVSAVRRGGWVDRFTMTITSVGIAMPSYWLGLLLIVGFSLNLEIFPASLYVPIGQDPVAWLQHLVLPAIALGTVAAAELTRQLRGSLIEAMDQEYIKTATAKGLPRWLVVGKHALKNSAGSATTVLGFHIVIMLGGSVIIEQIFAIPGLGSLAYQAVIERNIPVIQGVVLVAVAATVVVNLLTDITTAVLNPKVRDA